MPKTFFDVKKIERLARKASEKAIAKATAYLWKTARNSIKKSAGREKKYDLNVFLGHKGGDSYETVEDAKTYLASPDRANETIVQRDRQDVRSPQGQGSYRVRKPSAPGRPPKTHKAAQQNGQSHWLKRNIRFDPKAGTVFLNPSPIDKAEGRAKTLPPLLEEGGQAVSTTRTLTGYYVHKKYFKNGKITVSYRPVYERKEKRYQMKARPFLKPALESAAQQLIKILEGSFGK